MDSEEKAFWDHLEAHPEDSTCRLVFADWLQERGDLRAEGMRVLGRLGKWAGNWNFISPHRPQAGKWFWQLNYEEDEHTHCLGKGRWWNLFRKKTADPEKHPSDRATIESAAALAWLDLTQEERNGICKLD